MMLQLVPGDARPSTVAAEDVIPSCRWHTLTGGYLHLQRPSLQSPMQRRACQYLQRHRCTLLQHVKWHPIPLPLRAGSSCIDPCAAHMCWKRLPCRKHFLLSVYGRKC